MNLNKLFWTMVFVVLIFVGCGSNVNQNISRPISISNIYYTSEYIYNLQSVTLNGKNIANMNKEILTFEDKNLIFTFKIKHKYIDIEVFNKTNDTLKLLWNDIVYINYDGRSNGIIHNGIKFSEKDLTQYPSFITANSKINDNIVPRNKLIFLGTWYTRDLLSLDGNNVGTFNTDTKIKAENEANLYVGKTISLIIPIQNKDKIDQYAFNFLIKDFKIVTYDKYNY